MRDDLVLTPFFARSAARMSWPFLQVPKLLLHVLKLAGMTDLHEHPGQSVL
jgi:hypothetical protein